MKKLIILFVTVLSVIAIYSCNKNNSTIATNGKTQYLDLPSTVARYYSDSSGFLSSPADSMNAQATLGRVLFYDGHLSINNAISCGSCHKQALAFADNVALSSGFESKLTRRNSPPIQNLVPKTLPIFFNSNFFINNISTTLFWDGRAANVENLIARPITNHVEMGISDMSTLPAKLAALPYYSNLFTAAYGSSEITADKISNAIAMFIAAIESRSTRFDGFMAGTTKLSALEVEGMTLFNGTYNCAKCHHLSDSSNIGPYGGGGVIPTNFVDIGLDDTYTDMGRGEITGSAADNGKFKIPNLRNVAITAPYMHDGRYKTLDDVLEHYSHNIKGSTNLDTLLQDANKRPRQMNISDNDKEALKAFLNTLTDFGMINDPKFSNPFKTK